MLDIRNLKVKVDSKTVVKDLSLKVAPRLLHVLMGPNGAGKSSLGLSLMGHPHYRVNAKSRVLLNRASLLKLSPDQRAHEGLFLAFQYPVAIPGVSVQNALKAAYEAIHCTGCTLHVHCPKLSVTQFRHQLQAIAASLGIDPQLLSRPLNDGFSGGEKKRVEMIALHTLKPKFAILDETDSGLDVDSIKLVASSIAQAIQAGVGVLLITHYRRVLDYLKPDQVSVMINGRLAKTAGPELIDQIDQHGYSNFS